MAFLAGFRSVLAAGALVACFSFSAQAQDLCAGNSTAEGCEPADLGEDAGDGTASEGWTVFEQANAMISTPTVMVQTKSAEIVSGLFGSFERVTLVIQCQQNTTSVYFDFGENFMSDVGDRGAISYRIDARPLGIRNLTASEDNRALGLFGGLVAIPFVRELFAAEKLLLKAKTFEGQPVDVTFDLAGLDEAVVPLRQSCNW